MSLTALRITDFRIFKQQYLALEPSMNFIVGDNGSGKTSFLEAIYYLSHGRSFNTSSHNKVIRFDQDSFVLSADVEYQDDEIKVGLRRFRSNEVQIKIAGVAEKRVSKLAKILPVQLITPESFKLFFGGPKERRQFYDFGLFHVKHSFHGDWLRFTKIHRHRNALLKKKPRSYNDEFEYWDAEFCRLAQIISQDRAEYLDLFNSKFEEINLNIESYLSNANVSFELSPGYNQEIDLAQQLRNAFDKDVKFGYTSVGPHKSDIKIKTDNRLVEDVFSRGQLKMLLYVIKLLQSDIISDYKATPIMLIDDISSEVDEANLQKIFEYLQSSKDTQFFISSLNRDIADFMAPAQSDPAMFHVKHGEIVKRDHQTQSESK